MYFNVPRCWSRIAFKRNHANKEVLEFLRKIFLPKRSEIFIVALVSDQIVVVVVLPGQIEWLSSCHYAEHNDSKGENICLHSIIRFLLKDLWAGVGWGSTPLLEITDTVRNRQTEIYELEIEIVIEKKVFHLEVSMRNTSAVKVSD